MASPEISSQCYTYQALVCSNLLPWHLSSRGEGPCAPLPPPPFTRELVLFFGFEEGLSWRPPVRSSDQINCRGLKWPCLRGRDAHSATCETSGPFLLVGGMATGLRAVLRWGGAPA